MNSTLVANSVIASLDNVADRWLTPHTPWHDSAVQALQVSTGYAPEMICLAISNAFEELRKEKLIQFCANEKIIPQELPIHVLHILAGNVFTSWLPGAVITLLMGGTCWLKPSSAEPVMPELWKKSVEELSPELGQHIRIVPWDVALFSQVEAVVAYGSDSTITTLKSYAIPEVPFIAYGHKTSVAVVTKSALAPSHLPETIQSLRKDVSLFQLAGCLSPQTIYVEGDASLIVEGIKDLIRQPALKPFDGWQSFLESLQPKRGQFSGLGIAGDLQGGLSYESSLQKLGFTSIVSLGQLQRPPLLWQNGGFSLVNALRLATPQSNT